MKITWNGDANLANNIFGERYGYDWKYVSQKSSDIIVKRKIIRVGEAIKKAIT